MMNLIKRLSRLFGMRSYMTSLKPCPCCGGRHILFKSVGFVYWPHRFVCDDCGFMIENAFADVLLDKWERIPREKEV